MLNESYQRPFWRICIIGLGYIGLPTAAILAGRRVQVIGVDINEQIVSTINQGKVHIVEPNLDLLVQSAVKEKFLQATTKPEPADVFLITVPTPCTANHEADLKYVKEACLALAAVLKKGDLIIFESTSPVGTTENMATLLSECRPDLSFPQNAGEDSDIRLTYCPERVMPGQILDELVKNDRIIGGMTPKCAKRAVDLYKIFVEGECIITTARTAEMCKLTENSFRDVNIAFANELSLICDELHIDVWELIRLANRHPRVKILEPGPGVGGHCIAVDPWFIVQQAPEVAQLIRTARLVNDSKPEWVIGKVSAAVAEFLKENPGKKVQDITISCFGLSFKANVDDLRESPAVEIVKKLSAIHLGPIFVVEPYIKKLPQELKDVQLKESSDALVESDILVLLVAHKEFIPLFKELPSSYKIIDTRGICKSRGRNGK